MRRALGLPLHSKVSLLVGVQGLQGHVGQCMHHAMWWRVHDVKGVNCLCATAATAAATLRPAVGAQAVGGAAWQPRDDPPHGLAGCTHWRDEALLTADAADTPPR